MSWTYSGDPSKSDRDAVRFTVGDTDSDDELLQDQEITWLLSQYGGVQAASVAACETIAAKFARKADKAVGDLRISLSQKHKQYLTLADRIRRQGVLLAAAPYAGGISKADVDTQEDDTDRVEPKFTKDLHEYPETVEAD